jgi:hypothetical protein
MDDLGIPPFLSPQKIGDGFCCFLIINSVMYWYTVKSKTRGPRRVVWGRKRMKMAIPAQE